MAEDDRKPYLLEIVSDTICPWCYVGKKNLGVALELIGDDIAFDMRWRPFELNPDMPREGMDRKLYRSGKFGSWEKSQALDAQVKQAGASVGLAFHHDRMAMTPNTLASHVLVRMAGEPGHQDAVVEAIFKAYFTDGLDVGNPDILADIAVECGLDRTVVIQALQDEVLRTDVKSEATALSQAGVNGVPSVILNRHLLFSGALRPDLMADKLRNAVSNQDVIAAGAKVAAGG